MKEYYELLGLDSTASKAEIKTAFLALKKEAQKDLQDRDMAVQKRATEKITALTIAYKAVLNNATEGNVDSEPESGKAATVTDTPEVGMGAEDTSASGNQLANKVSKEPLKQKRSEDASRVNPSNNYPSEEKGNRSLILILGIVVIVLLGYIANAVATPSAPKALSVQPPVRTVTPEVKKSKSDIKEYYSMISKYNALRKKYDNDITANSEAINQHIGAYGSLRNANAVLARCEASEKAIKQTYASFLKETDRPNALSKYMKQTLELECVRATALREGVQNGVEGKDFGPAFKYGTDASYKYDDLDKKLDHEVAGQIGSK